MVPDALFTQLLLAPTPRNAKRTARTQELGSGCIMAQRTGPCTHSTRSSFCNYIGIMGSYIGIMEKKVEATVVLLGLYRDNLYTIDYSTIVILGLYGDDVKET